MSILLQPIWFDIRPYVRVEHYAVAGARMISIMAPSDPIVRQRLLDATMPCVSCGTRIYAIAFTDDGLFYRATCELETCQLSIDAREEYDSVIHALKLWRRDSNPKAPVFEWH